MCGGGGEVHGVVNRMAVREEALTLALWWALWSLADAYLLKYTPWSELLVLLMCALVVTLPKLVRTCVSIVRERVSKFRPMIDRL